MRHIDGANQRNRAEHRHRIWLAWHIAAFNNAKKLKPLEQLLKATEPAPARQAPPAPRRTQQTPEDHRNIAWMFNAAFGGSVIRKG